MHTILWVSRIHRVQKRATTDLNGHEIRGHVGDRAAHDAEARPKSTRRRSPGRTGSPERGLMDCELPTQPGPRLIVNSAIEPDDTTGCSAVVVSPANLADRRPFLNSDLAPEQGFEP